MLKKSIDGVVLSFDESFVKCDVFTDEDEHFIIKLPRTYFPQEISAYMAFSLSIDSELGTRSPIIRKREINLDKVKAQTSILDELFERF